MSTCYRDGGCGPYEMYPCSECPASKPEYAERRREREALAKYWAEHPVSTPVVTNYDMLIKKTPEKLAAWLNDNDSNFPFGDRTQYWLAWLSAPAEDTTCSK